MLGAHPPDLILGMDSRNLCHIASISSCGNGFYGTFQL